MARRVNANSDGRGTSWAFCLLCLLSLACWLVPFDARAGEAATENPGSGIPSFQQSAAPATQSAEEPENPDAADWAPALFDAILSSPNPESRDALLRAAFAAGPTLIPKLETALKDDRTAEFAAQAIAFIGGGEAIKILSKLADDPRDLGLQRFFYGALGEFDSKEAAQALVEAVSRADQEPDRTVTEAAILALTVRSDSSLAAGLRQTEKKIKDVVIRDDLDNALDVIEGRARFLATPEGKKSGGSIEESVRTYFIPALEISQSTPLPRSATGPTVGRGHAPAKPPATTKSPAPSLTVKTEIQNLTFSPDKARALTRVTFEDAYAVATYDLVVQKRLGDWTVVSVWLGSETEKTPPKPAAQPKD